MTKPEKSKHSKNVKIEHQAINIAETILESHDLISTKFTKDDKNNDIDGYFIVLNENRTEFGRLDVQIRALSINHNYSLPLSIKFLNYCRDSIPPVILIAVDRKQKKLFWIHLSRTYIERLNHEKNKATKTVHLEKSLILTENNISDTTIIQWKSIVNELREKIFLYDELKRQHEKYESLYNKIAKSSNPLLGKEQNEFHNIHTFLDELNGLLDEEFNITKRQFFPNTWKLGLGYWDYEPKKISYVLYAIPHDRNDIQIKKINTTIDTLLDQGYTIHAEGHRNPIEENPKQQAYYFTRGYITSILKDRFLEHGVNESLAREFIFASTDKFYIQLGLPIKDEYTLPELEFALLNYLPWWTTVALDSLKKSDSCPLNLKQEPVDPDDLAFWTKHKIKEIDDVVRSKLRIEGEIPPFSAIKESHDFPFRILYEFIIYLKSRNIETIKRIYCPKDLSRWKTGSNYRNLLSPEAFEKNLRTFFANLQEVYKDIITQNFPLLKHELRLFEEGSRMVVLFEAKEFYQNYSDGPRVLIYHLLNTQEKKDPCVIEVHNIDDKPEFKNFDLSKNRYIEINGASYEVRSISAYFSLMYDSLPLMNYVYETLGKRLNQYFRSMRL